MNNTSHHSRVFDSSYILRIVLAIVLLSHSLPGFFDGGVYDFGKNYLDEVGFSPVGVPLAWAVKLTHVIGAVSVLANKYVIPVAILNILILIMGIVLVHFKEGWYVVGGGRNGMEYNIVLIAIFLFLMFPGKIKKK